MRFNEAKKLLNSGLYYVSEVSIMIVLTTASISAQNSKRFLEKRRPKLKRVVFYELHRGNLLWQKYSGRPR